MKIVKNTKQRDFNIEDYDYYVREYIQKSEELGNPIKYDLLRKEPFNLPDGRWYINNCQDKSVKTWADFVDWCGFVAKGKTPSKDKMIKLIYKLQSEKDRALMYDDFRGRGCYHPPLEAIKTYWGTINNMKKELGLEIIQESMLDRTLTKDELDQMIKDICKYVKDDNRNFITTFEIDSVHEWLNADSLQRTIKKFYNCNLQTLLANEGISLGKRGRGITFDFSDGEHVTSQFEYIFSKYLREFGLRYGIDYFRDVKYSSFVPSYHRNMNCDYLIHTKDNDIYTEIAGVIEAYKNYFFSNRQITSSKSKETYRKDLSKKQKMFKENNIHYYILFPCDLTKDNTYNILNNDSIELRKSIEAFIKNNIDWDKVSKIGELKYSEEIKWGRNVIDYSEAV